MAFEFHKDKERYFRMQHETTRDYIIPFLETKIKVSAGLRILEIGCAEAGVLKAFTDKGCTCLGIELASNRLETARYFMKDEMEKGLITFMDKDIHDVDVENELDEKFDLVILKDVIEHIHDQRSFVMRLRDFLKDGGMIFYAFPPWYMPFGGHQQVAKNKFLSKLPYYHLLPLPLYKAFLRSFGETKEKIANLLEIKETGISIERFERVVRDANFEIAGKQHYLFNPIYKFKFGLQPKKQYGFISSIPFIRNFFTTGVYYLTMLKR
ncbi:MAG: methyltransferase domain-containing protein [Bacteroidetes bacterium]|nr:methyltransferase domain-containing protein [Bacteroidota bacterium]